MIVRAISRNGLVLGVFAMLTTGLIASTQLLTADRIAEQKRKAQEAALLEIFPRSRHDNQMLDDALPLIDSASLYLDEAANYFVASKNGQFQGMIIPTIAPDGYSGDIELLVGINADGSVAGVRTISHAETPGLGDKIELKKSRWVLDFDNRSLQDPVPAAWTVKKDKGAFDQFTGATITPRAVTLAVARTLAYYETHRDALNTAISARLHKELENGE